MSDAPTPVNEYDAITKTLQHYIDGARSGRISGTVATARLEADNWSGHRFTDLFTLLKVEGEWKIMNKVFHLHA